MLTASGGRASDATMAEITIEMTEVDIDKIWIIFFFLFYFLFYAKFLLIFFSKIF